MDIILNQIAVLMVLAIIGFLCEKKRYLPVKSGSYISWFVVKITAPLLILTTMSSYEFTAKTVQDGLWITFFALVFMFTGLLLGILYTKIFKIEGASANVFKTHSMLGNAGYLGLPLLYSLFGEKGLVYANFFTIALELLVWTVGVFLLNKHTGINWKENLKKILSPGIIAFIIGLILAVINIKHIASLNIYVGAVYNVLINTLKPLGNMTIYLVMIFIGMSMAENGLGNIKELSRKKISFGISLHKLIILPGIAYFFFHFFMPWLDTFVRIIIILELAMPCATIVPVLAAQYESDQVQATDNVIISTLFSMFTLPVALFVVNTYL